MVRNGIRLCISWRTHFNQPLVLTPHRTVQRQRRSVGLTQISIPCSGSCCSSFHSIVRSRLAYDLSASSGSETLALHSSNSRSKPGTAWLSSLCEPRHLFIAGQRLSSRPVASPTTYFCPFSGQPYCFPLGSVSAAAAVEDPGAGPGALAVLGFFLGRNSREPSLG
jgi:hypothetical protein